MKKKIFLLVFSLLCAGILNAAILNVPTDYATIQSGIDSSTVGDTVLVQPGTYVENINYNGKNITVASLFLTTQDTSYISQTVIDGDSVDTVVKFKNGEDSTSVFSGFTLFNGYGDKGGGIYLQNSSTNVNNVIIKKNSSKNYGGGIYCMNSSPILRNVTIQNNDALGYEEYISRGGGIYCYDSSPVLENVIIICNNASSLDHYGGGIYCENSLLILRNGEILKNTATGSDYDIGDGGGIYCKNSSLILENIIIKDNAAFGFNGYGGGIYYNNSSSPIMKNVTIATNSATYHGGGIFCDNNSSINFNDSCRCNIYSNILEYSRGSGTDIFSYKSLDVILDTFTVINPSDLYASPIDKFTFDILHSKEDSLINADIYVSVDGDDSNSGITPSEPLQTITKALSIIYSDSLNIHTIYLEPGIYSTSTNGESFPLMWNSYVNLYGSGEDETILDANQTADVIEFHDVTHTSIKNIKLMNGLSSFYDIIPDRLKNKEYANAKHKGGGVYCYDSDPCFENVTITENFADQGGGIYCYKSSPSLLNVTISNNSSYSSGGGMYCCHYSKPELNNVNIHSNESSGLGGGINCDYYSSATLKSVSITNNSAYFGGGISCSGSSPILKSTIITYNYANLFGGGAYLLSSSPCFTSVTISNNTADLYGGVCCKSNSSSIFLNCIVSDNSGEYGFYAHNSSPTIKYSNFFNNEGQNFYGLNDSIGVNVTTNANGDSCDAFYNIQLDPLFVDPLNGDYHLSWANYPIPDSTMSPCIDAGDPSSPPDPDWTIADMGAYYYHQPVSINEPEDNSGCIIWNFPNPTQNATTIKYTLKQNSHVIISIYNIKGQLVSTLVNETKPKGEYSVMYDTEALSSGVYFYKIQTEDISEIKKMIVIK